MDTPWPRAGRGDADDTLAHILALKWERHALLARIALCLARHGYQLSKSTLSGVSLRAEPLARRLVGAMIAHAKELAPYLAIDAAGAKVQAADRCTNGHTWMRFVEGIGVFVSFTAKHDALAANKLLDALGAKSPDRPPSARPQPQPGPAGRIPRANARNVEGAALSSTEPRSGTDG